MKLNLPILTLLVAIAPASLLSADVILSEDFEDTAVDYTQTGTVTAGGNTFDLGVLPDNTISNFMGTQTDYFGRVDNSIIEATYTGVSGNTFWGAQNTSGDTIAGADVVTLEWTGINIANFTNLTFDGLFASFDNLAGQWDPSTSVRIQSQIDGGGFFNVAAFESVNNSTDDRPVRQDIDFDGDGDIDGLLLDDSFQFLSANISGTGNLLDLRIIVDQLNSEGEDIAFDNITIQGDLQGVPEPASLLMFGSALAACTLPRRRKSLFSFLSK